jgi:hypothetical protein
MDNLDDTTTKPPRSAPGGMITAIGKWNADNTVFTVDKNLGESAPAKNVVAGVKALGVGAYDILIYRTKKVTYAKIEKDRVV